VEVPGEVEVDVLHRQHLGLPAAGPAALRPEHGPHGRLPEAQHRPGADPFEPLDQSDRRGRLALAERGRGDAGNDDDPAVGHVGEPVEHAEVDLRRGPPVELDLLRPQVGLGGDLLDRPEDGPLGQLEAVRGGHVGPAGGRDPLAANIEPPFRIPRSYQ
jgi:hypothetical protein